MKPLSPGLRNLKVILCHDWLTGMRGGERVLEVLCRAFPDAPVYTLVYDPSSVSDTIKRCRVIASPLQHIPGMLTNYRRFLPLFPLAIRSMKTERADLLISTSHCVAKGIRAPSGTRHLCYCFTPMRYAWLFYDEYFGGNPLKKLAVRPVLAALRRWDRSASNRVDRFATISLHVRNRIREYYGRESDVVYPPVNTEFWTPPPPHEAACREHEESYDLVVSALAPYKRIDLAVRAYARTGRRLVIVGTGPEFRRLRGMAAANIHFTGWLPDERIRELYRGCRLLVFPGQEDFGLVPLEGMACGRPVVAFARGGALETVKQDATGILFHDQSEESLIKAVDQCAASEWDAAAIRAHAEQFGENAFIGGLARSVERCLQDSSA